MGRPRRFRYVKIVIITVVMYARVASAEGTFAYQAAESLKKGKLNLGLGSGLLLGSFRSWSGVFLEGSGWLDFGLGDGFEFRAGLSVMGPLGKWDGAWLTPGIGLKYGTEDGRFALALGVSGLVAVDEDEYFGTQVVFGGVLFDLGCMLRLLGELQGVHLTIHPRGSIGVAAFSHVGVSLGLHVPVGHEVALRPEVSLMCYFPLVPESRDSYLASLGAALVF